ncbi:MAG: radical SAM protein [Synergistaceae bacterium]|nr:radical SAM protein [Synergistaceae bacterium]
MRRLAFFIPFQGCTRRCVYCDQAAITGSGVPRPGDVALCVAQYSQGNLPIELCFFGGSFARLDPSLMESYLLAIRGAPDGSAVTFSSYPGDFEGARGAALAKFLGKYPIGTIELGVPSLDPKVLAACGRDDDADGVKKIIVNLARAGFHLGVQTMIGLPEQSLQSARCDMEALAALIGASGARDVWDLRIYPCLILRGTALEGMYRRGEYSPLRVEDAVRQAGQLLVSAERAGFRAIRVGLLDSDSLRKAVIAGPYHPSFGELALSEKLALQLAEKPDGPWEVDERHVSHLTGHGRRGLRRLSELTGMSEENVRERLIGLKHRSSKY